MTRDMERDTLVQQHGAYDYRVQNYDRQQAQAARYDRWPDASSLPALGGAGNPVQPGGASGADASGSIVGFLLAVGALALAYVALQRVWALALEIGALATAERCSGARGARICRVTLP